MTRDRNKRWDVPRRPASTTATILHDGCKQICLIEERSPLGARIRVNPDLRLPERFSLEVAPGEFTSAKAAWRHGDRVGVKLDLPVPPTGFFRQMWDWLKPDSVAGWVGIVRLDAPKEL